MSRRPDSGSGRCAAQRTDPGLAWRRLQREETMETIEDLLESHPFFAGLSLYALELIAGCASNVHFDEGSRIFDQGEPASSFYVIRHGRVALEVQSPARGPVIIDTMDGGEVLGWSWLIPP